VGRLEVLQALPVELVAFPDRKDEVLRVRRAGRQCDRGREAEQGMVQFHRANLPLFVNRDPGGRTAHAEVDVPAAGRLGTVFPPPSAWIARRRFPKRFGATLAANARRVKRCHHARLASGRDNLLHPDLKAL
jgi:hypothetical protein